MGSRSSASWAALAASAVLCGCGQSRAGGVEQDPNAAGGVHQTYDDFHDLALEKRAEIERTLEAQLDSARETLSDIASEASKQGEVEKKKLAEELQREQALAQEKLDQLRGASAEEWQRLCRETQTEAQRLTEEAKALFQDG
jgi:hypothetical protein